MTAWKKTARGIMSLAALALLSAAGCRNSARSAQASAGEFTRGAAMAPVQHPAPGEPAPNFNFYVFSLSWSPEYCHGHPNSAQCDGSHPGFVVHGLWPQRNDGQWPSSCSDAPGLSDPDSMLDIMPSRRLIAHEWAKHGTCTGLSPQQYFGAIRQAYRSVHVPSALVHPMQTRRTSTLAIKRMFLAANPGLTAADMAITCHNRYLSGVEICLNQSLEPTACQSVRDCTANSITIPHLPVR
jgi:ribonuclease T2